MSIIFSIVSVLCLAEVVLWIENRGYKQGLKDGDRLARIHQEQEAKPDCEYCNKESEF